MRKEVGDSFSDWVHSRNLFFFPNTHIHFVDFTDRNFEMSQDSLLADLQFALSIWWVSSLVQKLLDALWVSPLSSVRFDWFSLLHSPSVFFIACFWSVSGTFIMIGSKTSPSSLFPNSTQNHTGASNSTTCLSMSEWSLWTRSVHGQSTITATKTELVQKEEGKSMTSTRSSTLVRALHEFLVQFIIVLTWIPSFCSSLRTLSFYLFHSQAPWFHFELSLSPLTSNSFGLETLSSKRHQFGNSSSTLILPISSGRKRLFLIGRS